MRTAAEQSEVPFKINTDNTKVIRQDVPFRSNYVEFNKSFPHYDQSTLVVVGAETRSAARDAAIAIADELRKSPEVFRSIYVLSEGQFFDDHALLYLELDELEQVVRRLSEAQPALAALNKDPSLRGLSRELVNAIEAAADGESIPGSFARITPVPLTVASASLLLAHVTVRPASELPPESWGSAVS